MKLRSDCFCVCVVCLNAGRIVSSAQAVYSVLKYNQLQYSMISFVQKVKTFDGF